MTEEKHPNKPSFFNSLLSGGVAGFTVDVLLFPLDTVKTRLQSSQGFVASGGFKGIYSGLRVAALGSVPGAAFFFSTYESMKYLIPKARELTNPNDPLPAPIVHMSAAGLGELTACLIRVPTDVVKQRYQAKMIKHDSLLHAIASIYKEEGLMKGFYSGYLTTILRELPFSFIQFPIYEWMKMKILEEKRKIQSYEAAICGSISGGIAAAITTPLDVAKTRLMLGKNRHGVPYLGLIDTIVKTVAEAKTDHLARTGGMEGLLLSQIKVFFAGLGPRVMWISIGGFIFFGAYEQSIKIFQSVV